MQKDKENLAKRNIFFLGLVSFFNDFASEMIYPLLPFFLTVVLGAGAAVLGIVEGVAESTAAILKFLSGYFSDRYKRRKPIFAAGYTLSNVVRPLMGATGAWWHLLFLRFSDRVGKGVRTSPRDALLADSAGKDKMGFAFGFQRALDHAGAVMGPLAATLLLPLLNNNLRHLFFLSAIPGVVVLIIVYFAVKEVKPSGEKNKVSLRESLSGVDGNFKYYLVVVLIFTLGNSSDAFLLLKATDANISMVHIPILWMILHIVKAVTSTPGGILSDKIGRKKVIIAGWAVYGIIYIAFALTTTASGIWILFAFYGIYFGLTEGAEKAMVADMVKEDRLGTAYGLFNLAVGLAAFPASVAFGFVWQYFGPKYAFFMGAILALVSSVMLLKVKVRRL